MSDLLTMINNHLHSMEETIKSLKNIIREAEEKMDRKELLDHVYDIEEQVVEFERDIKDKDK